MLNHCETWKSPVFKHRSCKRLDLNGEKVIHETSIKNLMSGTGVVCCQLSVVRTIRPINVSMKFEWQTEISHWVCTDETHLYWTVLSDQFMIIFFRWALALRRNQVDHTCVREETKHSGNFLQTRGHRLTLVSGQSTVSSGDMLINQSRRVWVTGRFSQS